MLAGMKTYVLLGPPGCGKTRRAEMAAAQEGATLVFYQCHAWTDADELFVGVDVAAAVAGDPEHVRQEGVLTRAARLSHNGLVVLVIDEIDKAPERVEALLLDFLQSGRAPYAPGHYIQARIDNLEVYLTSNNSRPLSDALLRRCRRVWMRPLTADEVERISAEQVPDAPPGVITTLRKAAWACAQAEGRDHVTVAEFVPLLREALAAVAMEDLQDALSGWAARTEAGAAWALGIEGRKALAPAWAEILRIRGAR